PASSARSHPSFPTRRSSDLPAVERAGEAARARRDLRDDDVLHPLVVVRELDADAAAEQPGIEADLVLRAALRHEVRVPEALRLEDRKSTRLNSSHVKISYAV